jgi:5-methylcytosine-specific restriction endonuclease McrA
MKKPTFRGRPDVDRKIEFLQKHKMEKGCSVCGYNEIPQALEFDHIDRSKKKFGMNKAWKYKWSTIMEELEKCVVLCSNCHRKKTIEEKDYLQVDVKEELEEVRQYDLFGDLS